MPRLDKTGPRGAGPMTGRGLGPCGRGMGYGRGYGRGMGYGGRFARRSFLTPNEELQDLEDEAAAMEADLKALKDQIAELKK